MTGHPRVGLGVPRVAGAMVTVGLLLAAAGVGCASNSHEASGVTATVGPFVLLSGTAAASTPRPRVTGTPTALPTPQPIAAEDEVWQRIAAGTEGSLHPLLRPPALPAGFETVLDKRVPAKPTAGFFDVEYNGPGRLLVIAAGPPNPLPGFEPGHQEQLIVRGQRGVLAVGDDRDPNVSSWVFWQEPGLWRPEGTQGPRPSMTYLVRGQGMSPKELLAIVEALQPWLPE